MTDEYVSARTPSGSRVVRKSLAQDRGWPYRLLAEQPLSAAEQRVRARERAEVEVARSAMAKVAAARRGGQWSEERGLGGGKVVLTERERRSLERQIGVPVADAQDARRKMKERGMRFLEKGEEMEATLQAQIDYADRDGRRRGEPSPTQFPGWDKLAGAKAPAPFDHAGRLAYHTARLARQNSDD